MQYQLLIYTIVSLGYISYLLIIVNIGKVVMNKKSLLIIITLNFLVFLAGCATTATGSEFAKVENTNSENESLIYIYRPAEGFWTGLNTVLYLSINDELIGPLKKGGYLTAQVPEGNAQFVVKSNAFNDIFGGIPKLDNFIAIPAGEEIYFKVVGSRSVVGSTNSLSMQAVPEEIALEHIKTLKQSN